MSLWHQRADEMRTQAGPVHAALTPEAKYLGLKPGCCLYDLRGLGKLLLSVSVFLSCRSSLSQEVVERVIKGEVALCTQKRVIYPPCIAFTRIEVMWTRVEPGISSR